MPEEFEIALEEVPKTIGFSVPVGSVVVFTVLPTTTYAGHAKSALRVATNARTASGEPFEPGVFRELPRPATGAAEAALVLARLEARCAGFFEFRLVECGSLDAVVAGHVRVEAAGRAARLAGLAVQSLVPKLLGRVETAWPAHLEIARRCGYNALHLTPVQPLGASNSAYCLREHLDVSAALFAAPGATPAARIAQLRAALQAARAQHGFALIGDVVLPHMAVDAPWLAAHPEAAYSLTSAPHLRVAFALDCAFKNFACELADGRHGSPAIASDADITRVLDEFRQTTYRKFRLWEFYVFDVDAEVALLEEDEDGNGNGNSSNGTGNSNNSHKKMEPEPTAQVILDTAVRDPGRDRFSIHVNPSVRERFHSRGGLRAALEAANATLYARYDSDTEVVFRNSRGVLAWQCLDPAGPRVSPVTRERLLMPSYFAVLRDAERLAAADYDVSGLRDLSGVVAVAHHGWVMDSDPFTDFAGDRSWAYLRREVIAWGDCAKLRYGTRHSDNPVLWEHMAAYVELMAGLFDGFRIDNCHSVPLPVLQFLLGRARAVNPDLVVFAELFAPSYDALHGYTAACGIDGLLREACAPPTQAALHQLLYENCGAAERPLACPPALPRSDGRRAAPPVPVRGWVFDQTHDNRPLLATRAPQDTLATAALAAMCAAPTGSVRGYDELVPFLVDVVRERRPFAPHADAVAAAGIARAKRLFGALHADLAARGYAEAYVESNGPAISIARMNPDTLETVTLVAHCAFPGGGDGNNGDPAAPSGIPPITLPGVVKDVRFIVSMEDVEPLSEYNHWPNYNSNEEDKNKDGKDSDEEEYLTGLYCTLKVSEHVGFDVLEREYGVRVEQGERSAVLDLRGLKRGAVVCVACTQTEAEQAARAELDRLLQEGDDGAGVGALFAGATLEDMNVLLYRCGAEERAESALGVYEIPGRGPLTYCGLQGWEAVLGEALARTPADLGAAVFANLRAGDWALDYVAARLRGHAGLERVRAWLERCFACVRGGRQPRHLVPKHFARVVHACYNAAVAHSLAQMSPFVQRGSPFVQRLALGSVQLYGALKSAPLIGAPSGAPEGTPPEVLASLSAGLEHFSTGYMRSWGRDTFVALRGLLLVPGRYAEARELILGYGQCVRHGLVPNLLDSGRHPRYNCRDAAWYWLKAVCDYVEMAPRGPALLREMVLRRYGDAASAADATDASAWASVADLVQDVLACHARGIHFRERNAGRAIDDRMQDGGFDVDVACDAATGFAHGGNALNCGTWMDKMGSSARAGNRGVPATPRDGAAVEIVALQHAVLARLARLHRAGIYPHPGVCVPRASGDDSPHAGGHHRLRLLTYAAWAARIARSFHRCFYVPPAPADDAAFDVDARLVHRRGIYKDSYRSSGGWTDYQLRPNYLVAMAAAPALFAPHAAAAEGAVRAAQRLLCGPLGMRTLDPADWAYRPNYDNDDDSTDRAVAGGFNYHQGPEWLWPFGCFLQALVRFGRFPSADARDAAVYALLQPHVAAVQSPPWYALPELTNANGAPCPGSCNSQAWSFATILEALYLLHQVDNGEVDVCDLDEASLLEDEAALKREEEEMDS